jgi:hypothetical protein
MKRLSFALVMVLLAGLAGATPVRAEGPPPTVDIDRLLESLGADGAGMEGDGNTDHIVGEELC